MTFRFRGHSFGDQMKYMPKEQLAAAQAVDPVPAYRQHLLDTGVSPRTTWPQSIPTP